jgi:C1A family cysteine protease
MQLRTKWAVLALAILLLSSVGTTGLVLAQSNSSAPVAQTSASLPATLQKEPLNPAFVQYQQNKSAGKVATQTVNGLGLGWVPPPYELSKAPTATSLAQAQAQATYPATYDLRTLNKVSPVENQGSCGSCWTFATFGSLESYLLPGLTTTYSENNLKNFADFDYTCCAGGDSAMSTAYLARWGTTMTDATGATIHGGPVTSASDPYSDSSCTSPTTSQIAMHVQNVYFLPKKQSPLDNNAIKSALMTYGGVYTAFQWEGATSGNTPYWNPTTAAYYDGSTTGANHGVTIVGWDDNFSAKNFSTTPSGNGAWIVKNSWGTSWGKSGYFYVSYYDLNMGYQENTVFTAQPTTNYTTNYQYDPFGMETTIGSGSSTAYGANVFTANSTGTLNAVSFWAPVEDTQYTAQVYVNPTSSSNPTSGTLTSTISGTASNAGFSYAGYYTESLSTTVPLTKGEKFAVVIKFTTPGDGNPVPVQYKESGWDDNAPNAIAGQSFYSLGGTTWSDLAVAYGAANSYVANIHAFESSSSIILTASASPTKVTLNQNFTISGTLTNGTPSSGIAGATITLQNSTDDATWNNVTTTVTGATGNYQFSNNESVPNNYYYRTAFDGNATYASATSNIVNVNVYVPITSSPAVSAQNANSLDLFVNGTNGSMWYKYWTGTTWTAPTSLGGNVTSSPAATSRAPGYLDVFARGSNGALWSDNTTNNGASWNGWYQIGGQLAPGTGPAADARGTNSLDVFVQGTNQVLYYTHWNGATWSGWASLGGALTSSPAATSPTSGVIDVFVRGTDGAIWEKTTTNGGSSWSSWASLGGQIASGAGPAASSWSSGRLDVFVQGTNGAMYQKTWTGTSWSGWQSLGGVLTSSPAATSPSPGTIDVFVLGSDNGLWQKSYSNGAWGSWMSADGI